MEKRKGSRPQANLPEFVYWVGKYRIPAFFARHMQGMIQRDSVLTAIEAEVDEGDCTVVDGDPSSLTAENYVEYFRQCLYLEEIQANLDIRIYDMFNVSITDSISVGRMTVAQTDRGRLGRGQTISTSRRSCASQTCRRQ